MSNLSGKGVIRGSLRVGGGSLPQDVYWDDILDKPEFAAVATSGSYNDLEDKPTVMMGATEQLNGAAGFAPQPLAGDQDKFLNGAGEWATPSSSGVNYSTDEQVGGTWIDGSIIYFKTFNFTNRELSYGREVNIGNITDGISIRQIINAYLTSSIYGTFTSTGCYIDNGNLYVSSSVRAQFDTITIFYIKAGD